MKLAKEARLLRIFLGEADKHQGRPLAEAVLELARKSGMAGATVFHGAMGFGASSHIHTTKVLRLSEDLPVLVEMVDSAAKIKRFLKDCAPLLQGGLVTVEKIEVCQYGPRTKRH